MKIKPETYQGLYDQIKRFLDGNTDEAEKDLKEKMQAASNEERYEDAQGYKEMIEAIERTVAKQAVEISTDHTDRDVFAYAERDGYLSLSIMTYRRGLLARQKSRGGAFFRRSGRAGAGIDRRILPATTILPTEIACNVPGFAEEFLSRRLSRSQSHLAQRRAFVGANRLIRP
jgi:excinuclease UvrABC nuclease subunit